MVFRRGTLEDQSSPTVYKEGLNQIDCKLTTKEGGVVKYYRAIS